MKYKAHDYQAYATNFILEHPISAVFLDMGLGKSIITLSAIFDLCLDSFLVRKCNYLFQLIFFRIVLIVLMPKYFSSKQYPCFL